MKEFCPIVNGGSTAVKITAQQITARYRERARRPRWMDTFTPPGRASRHVFDRSRARSCDRSPSSTCGAFVHPRTVALFAKYARSRLKTRTYGAAER